jgi:DNA-directed RNA polymerase specialized sigma24 family protein
MDENAALLDRFEEDRTRLRAMAYRMLGSVSEADDALQESWLRVSRADAGGVENLGGWLTTVVSRVCLNMLRQRESRREEPLEVRLPQPATGPEGGTDPEEEALLADSVGVALLVVLDTLAPAERLAFVLHDLFAVPFDEIGPLIEPPPRRTPTRGGGGGSSTRSWRRRGAGTSARCSPCSTPMWCSTPTRRSSPAPSRSRSTAPGPWRRARRPRWLAPGTRASRWWTVRWGS